MYHRKGEFKIIACFTTLLEHTYVKQVFTSIEVLLTIKVIKYLIVKAINFFLYDLENIDHI